MNDFFRKNGVATLTVRELFDFATDPNIDETNIDAALDKLMEVACSRPIGSLAEEEEVADRVFAQAFIPRRLEEVANYERDQERMKKAGGANVEGIFYQTITGMKADLSGARTVPVLLEGEDQGQCATSIVSSSKEMDAGAIPDGAGEEKVKGDSKAGKSKAQKKAGEVEGEEGESGSDSDEESESGSSFESVEGMDKDAIRAARRANKKLVKEANKERRKVKAAKKAKGKGSKKK